MYLKKERKYAERDLVLLNYYVGGRENEFNTCNHSFSSFLCDDVNFIFCFAFRIHFRFDFELKIEKKSNNFQFLCVFFFCCAVNEGELLMMFMFGIMFYKGINRNYIMLNTFVV